MTIPVTLIIPILNEASSLPSLLEAIQQQSAMPQEIIFCDAGSCDASLSIIEDYKNNLDWRSSLIRVIITRGARPGEGRNVGVKASTTEWIAFLDGGIDPEKDWLKELYQMAITTDAPAVFGLCHFSSDDNFSRAVCALSYGQASAHPVIPSTLFNRKVFNRIGYFPEHLRAAEDIVWLNRFLEKYGKRVVCDVAHSHYRHFPPNWLQVFKKWRLFEKNSVIAGVRTRQHIIYLITIPLLYAFLFSGTYFSVMLFFVYAVFRGVVDPIRRSASWHWFKGYPMATFIAIPLALWIDFAKLSGITDAYTDMVIRFMSKKPK
ncbi:MAG: glycosyltransferase [Bacteroidetes bacterium]|nr:glycosyltransferase [Bacteroidota bacterium]